LTAGVSLKAWLTVKQTCAVRMGPQVDLYGLIYQALTIFCCLLAIVDYNKLNEWCWALYAAQP
jgi:hypothetical protein